MYADKLVAEQQVKFLVLQLRVLLVALEPLPDKSMEI
jgi:hypothetical protein